MRFPWLLTLIPSVLIQRFCVAHDIQELALFGSVVRSDFTAGSDIDILVRFAPEAKVGLFEMAQFEDALSRLFDHRHIDLRTINEIHPKLRDQVLSEREVLYDG